MEAWMSAIQVIIAREGRMLINAKKKKREQLGMDIKPS
jgi:hypothetical protein